MKNLVLFVPFGQEIVNKRLNFCVIFVGRRIFDR